MVRLWKNNYNVILPLEYDLAIHICVKSKVGPGSSLVAPSRIMTKEIRDSYI